MTKEHNLKKQYTLDEKHVAKLATDVLEYVKKYNITLILLKGDLGVGKTFFTQTLGQLLGINEPITSPTYALQNIYNLKKITGFKKLIHIDAYRLDNESFDDLAIIEHSQDKSNLILIEWAEHIKHILKNIPFIEISIKPHKDNKKRIYSIKLTQ